MINGAVGRSLGEAHCWRGVREVATCDPGWEKPALRLAMVPQEGPVYVFQTFRVDLARRLIRRGEERVRVTAKVFDLLLALIRSRHRVATREELIRQLWPDTFVEDGNLSVHISALRKALSDTGGDRAVIETLPRVGYRFVAEVGEE
jgi:DNA-binding winged helix-turn-helix (wHTH) protein